MNNEATIIVLGAIGSLVGTLLIWLGKRIGRWIIERGTHSIFTSLLYQYAKNSKYVELCEEQKRPDLVIIKYHMTQAKFTRHQVVFIVEMIMNFLLWFVYFRIEPFPLLVLIIFGTFLLYSFFSFLKWYIAVGGCLPEKMGQLERGISNKKGRERFLFVFETLKKRNYNKKMIESN